jgi:hypothetical protein
MLSFQTPKTPSFRECMRKSIQRHCHTMESLLFSVALYVTDYLNRLRILQRIFNRPLLTNFILDNNSQHGESFHFHRSRTSLLKPT